MPTQIELVKELSADSSNWHEKYPWYSLGQLVNVSNKKQSADFQPAAQAAAIFFNDIQRMHWLLHEQAFNKNKILSELNVPVSTEGMQLTPQPFPKREHIVPITAPTHLIAVAAVNETDAVAYKALGLEASSVVKNEDDLNEDIIIHHAANEVEENNLVADKSKNYSEAAVFKEDLIEPTKIYVQQPEAVKEPTEDETLIVKEKILLAKDQNLEESGDKKMYDAAIGKNENGSVGIADDLTSITKAQENIKAALDGGASMDLTFEPYHTIDYFASQGIKVDAKMDDRLGKQLKSFTSWLKTMKRLPVTEETAGEAQMLPINDKSLENTNVVTEAMAAVLIKQGKKDQAVEIFRKLSLLHPEKSRYFAAQIEQIKI